MKHFLRWLLLASACGVGTALLVITGTLGRVWCADVTKLSFIILAVFWIFIFHLGAIIWQYARGHYLWMPADYWRRRINPGWFVADKLTKLGMLGTVLGFIYMLSTSLSSVNLKDIASLQGALTCMGVGMGTALYTTAAGLMCAIPLRLQLYLFDRAVADEHAR